MKNLHGLDLEASEDVPISSFPRRRDYKAVTVTTDMPTLLKAAIEQNFVPVVDDRNVFIGMVRRTVLIIPQRAADCKPLHRRWLPLKRLSVGRVVYLSYSSRSSTVRRTMPMNTLRYNQHNGQRGRTGLLCFIFYSEV